MKRSYNNAWRSKYHTYGVRYKEQRAVSQRVGVAIDEKLSFREFKTVYKAMAEDAKAAGSKSPNIIQNMTRAQMQYKYSQAQTRSIREAYKRFTDDDVPTYSELRKFGKEAINPQFWDEIRARIDELKGDGVEARDRRDIIAQEFFGS